MDRVDRFDCEAFAKGVKEAALYVCVVVAYGTEYGTEYGTAGGMEMGAELAEGVRRVCHRSILVRPMSAVKTSALSSTSSSDCENVVVEKADGGEYGADVWRMVVMAVRMGLAGFEREEGCEDRLVALACVERRRAVGMKLTSDAERELAPKSWMPRPAISSSSAPASKSLSPSTWLSAEGRERSRRPCSASSSRRDILRRYGLMRSDALAWSFVAVEVVDTREEPEPERPCDLCNFACLDAYPEGADVMLLKGACGRRRVFFVMESSFALPLRFSRPECAEGIQGDDEEWLSTEAEAMVGRRIWGGC